MAVVDTLTQAINELRYEGYTEDFNLHPDCISCREGQIRIMADEFQVDKVYRFEGMTDPADESVVYGISSDKYGMKGVLVNGYGIYSDPVNDELMSRLQMRPERE